ncbi:MAG TPA: response regulator [Alphaproteobacteria bacterium]|nr:response regulator [Alphaproteobacteria bacterium]
MDMPLPTVQATADRPLNILLVEDNVVDARLVFGLLETPADALHCRTASTLAEALSLLRSFPFDVVLLDLNLDDSSGYATFAAVQSASRAAVLVMSGSDDEELAVKTVREGAQDYLVKGFFDRKLLLRSIRYAFERKRSEEALRESEGTVRAIFESSLDGIVITDDGGLCLEANSAAASLVGVSRDHMLDSKLSEFSEEDFAVEWKRFLSAGAGRGQFFLRRKDGNRRLVDCCFKANILPGRHLCVLRDITEQQNLEKQLRQSQKMEAVGRLAGGVAHDFNNILGVISGYTELLQLGSKDQTQISKLEKIVTATKKASSLTKQLLAFGRKQVMSPKLLDLSAVMGDLTSMVHCLVGAEILVTIKTEKDLGLVKADQGQLEQVILNLCVNARDAMPEGGTLHVEIKNHTYIEQGAEIPPGQYVMLSVKDSGIGMDHELQSHIFEPFFTTKRTGSGLGLSTVYGIVTQSGGYVNVQSEPGNGSTFNVYLPRVSGPAAKMEKAEKPPQSVRKGTETILLVDDEDDLRESHAEYLEGLGYKVLRASNGKDAAALADGYQGTISLLISDIVMPKLNGAGLVDHLRRTRPNIAVLVISGFADDAIIRHGIFLDTTCFLQKPFTFQVLGEKVRGLLDQVPAVQ